MDAIIQSFRLPAQLAAKADPALIADDDRRFVAIEASLAATVDDLSARLDAVRRSAAGKGRQAVDRDEEVQRLSARLRALRRYSLDICLGRMVSESGEITYIGRFGLTDSDGRRLLLDWRSPAAEPFFGATHANPMGLLSRRRYRWTGGHVTDYWDEVFVAGALEGHAALDDQSAFIASLGSNRSARMRDVLGTIQADQDAIIRAGSGGALVVDGGPGTGKTVVALHRTAYLLYSEPRMQHRVLFVGPHEPYLAYVSDVLPSLGEEGVQACTLRDLVPEGATAAVSDAAAHLKSSAGLVAAIEAAVRFYEEPPTSSLVVATDDVELTVTADDWAEAFAAPGPGTPHNEGREQVWDELVEILLAKDKSEEPSPFVRGQVARDRGLLAAFNRAWPVLEPADIVADLWSVPAYLRRCAPWLEADEIRALQRSDPREWTVADLPLLDAARHRVGDPGFSRRQREDAASEESQRRTYARVFDDLLASHEYDDGEGLMQMFMQQDMREGLVSAERRPESERDRLSGTFAHIVVDEAQELTDAEWQMLLLRCPSRSFTIVGDRAQARHGFTESWTERLNRAGIPSVRMASLTVNYRTPAEIMTEAAPVIRAVLPDANVPTSIRESGVPVAHGSTADLRRVLDDWFDAHDEGVACVIGDLTVPDGPRVRSLTPVLAKGLEFDLVILVDPQSFGGGIEGAVDRYVAMTRATQRLVILTS
ncbi:AAA family ATPase [Actinoplanes bogorensis]|uniref:AAA family ATPase n=1 Tax=Paractinoplanes bogorensis TaxID=1610840 RepID=A0ABS5YL79_9ACTN|nr:RNA polymerase recycling motor ATPase HelR [Actinoplanes bogorensis]MBU2664205.1 AAA family ATPase [Actinoplanes bogorensis]